MPGGTGGFVSRGLTRHDGGRRKTLLSRASRAAQSAMLTAKHSVPKHLQHRLAWPYSSVLGEAKAEAKCLTVWAALRQFGLVYEPCGNPEGTAGRRDRIQEAIAKAQSM